MITTPYTLLLLQHMPHFSSHLCTLIRTWVTAPASAAAAPWLLLSSSLRLMSLGSAPTTCHADTCTSGHGMIQAGMRGDVCAGSGHDKGCAGLRAYA